MRRFVWALAACAAILLLGSCATTDGTVQSWHTVTSPAELSGTWHSERGQYEYPFATGGKKYLRYAWSATDDTDLWAAYAQRHGMTTGQLWQKRFAYAPYVYADEGYREPYPLSDANGTQQGRKLFEQDGRLYSRMEVLVPESVLILNLGYFLMRDDNKAFVEQGEFYFASDVFTRMTPDGTQYVKGASR